MSLSAEAGQRAAALLAAHVAFETELRPRVGAQATPPLVREVAPYVVLTAAPRGRAVEGLDAGMAGCPLPQLEYSAASNTTYLPLQPGRSLTLTAADRD